MSEKILEVIGKLDPENDNHWTVDGAAKLEIIKFLMGGESVSRETLEKIAPGFNRESMRAYLSGGSVNAPTPVRSGNEHRSEPVQVEQRPPDREIEIQTLAEKVRIANETVEQLQRLYNETREKLKLAQIEADKLNDELLELNPPETTQNVIQQYLAGQKKILEQRAESINMVKNSGVDLKLLAKLTSRAPIDQFMAGRRRR